jgi:subtilisin family serine protease
MGRRLGVVVGAVALTLGVGGTGPAGAVPAAPDDPGFSLQWGLADIGAPAAWAVADGSGITIAIVDSGIDLTHEDLAAKIVANVSCIGSAGDSTRCVEGQGQDDDGHGTHVAGIAAAITGNGRGVAGVAPGASLMAVRVLKHTCDLSGQCTASGSAADVAAGIRWAADHGAQVINLSLGASTQAVLGPDFASAISYAWGKGAIPVVAAGNQFVLGSGFKDQPAMVVSAVGPGDVKASYSNGVGAAKWGIAAPGGDGDDGGNCKTGHQPTTILSTYWNPAWGANVYACLAGTSMAAPHVSGAAAVLRSAGLSPQETVDRLLESAKDLGNPSEFGAGRLDLTAAVQGLGGPEPTTTSTAATSTSTTAAPATTATPSSTTQAGSPVTAEPTPSSSPVAAQLSASQTAAHRRDDLPTGPVALAVALVVLSAGANTWWTFKHAGWARRTP